MSSSNESNAPKVFSHTKCTLGEGPMWHPKRKTLIWFDIVTKRMFEQRPSPSSKETVWELEEPASAAGWIDHDTILIATSSGLYKFDLSTGNKTLVVEMEVDNPNTRSNDGRADPFGGFWIGTVGMKCEPNAGSLYRFYKGELRQLFADDDKFTIYNATCFSPDKKTAYFCDTVKHMIEKVDLDEEGWPIAGTRRMFVDLSKTDETNSSQPLLPDGAVVDSEGNLWSAQFGSSRVACYSHVDGSFLREIMLPTKQTTCPAFGGEDAQDLFVTTSTFENENDENAGKTYLVKGDGAVKGQEEHRVIL